MTPPPAALLVRFSELLAAPLTAAPAAVRGSPARPPSRPPGCQGYSLLLKPAKRIDVDDRRITLRGGETYGCVEIDVRRVLCF